jgi:hypothetical protein
VLAVIIYELEQGMEGGANVTALLAILRPQVEYALDRIGNGLRFLSVRAR